MVLQGGGELHKVRRSATPKALLTLPAAAAGIAAAVAAVGIVAAAAASASAAKSPTRVRHHLAPHQWTLRHSSAKTA